MNMVLWSDWHWGMVQCETLLTRCMMYVYHLTKLKMVQYLNYMSVCKIAAKPASDAQVELSKVRVDVFASDVSSIQIRHGYVM